MQLCKWRGPQAYCKGWWKNSGIFCRSKILIIRKIRYWNSLNAAGPCRSNLDIPFVQITTHHHRNPLDATNYFRFVCKRNTARLKRVYSKYICVRNIKICIKMPQGETLKKPGKRKTDHKSKFGVIQNQYFQACWRIIPISYRQQRTQIYVGQTYTCAGCLTKINRKDSSAGRENIDSKRYRPSTNDQPFICNSFIQHFNLCQNGVNSKIFFTDIFKTNKIRAETFYKIIVNLKFFGKKCHVWFENFRLNFCV